MIKENARCPITGDPVRISPAPGDFQQYECPTCGVFRISKTALALADENNEVLREALIAARNQAGEGETPVIDNLSG
jgi:hypothetical protein